MVAELHPIKIKATNEEEEYILEEARIWLQENIFSSCMNPNNPHITNVVNLGRKNTPFLMGFLRENDHPQGMYTHFLLDVIFRLYKDEIKVEGYLGVDGCTKLLLKIYDSGLMDDMTFKEAILTEDYRHECPYCHTDVSEQIKTSEDYKSTDTEKVDDNKYGVQVRWKQIYECPHCRGNFYITCEH